MGTPGMGKLAAWRHRQHTCLACWGAAPRQRAVLRPSYPAFPTPSHRLQARTFCVLTCSFSAAARICLCRLELSEAGWKTSLRVSWPCPWIRLGSRTYMKVCSLLQGCREEGWGGWVQGVELGGMVLLKRSAGWGSAYRTPKAGGPRESKRPG